MELTVARTAGFCFGVQRAVDTVYEQIEEAKKSGERVYTYGPIIHNEHVVREFAAGGVQVVDTPEELAALQEGTVIIRSHGAPESIYRLCEEKGLRVVDATCPFVKRIHRTVQEQNALGRRVLIIGDPAHPEVEGIRGWGRPDTVVLQNMDELPSLNLVPEADGTPLAVVAQTTFNHRKFKEMIAEIKALGYDLLCFNTICNATQERQEEAAKLASDSDAMVIIGSSHSSNTRKLYEISKERCDSTFFVDSAEELAEKKFPPAKKIGITAGASTPKHIIEEVQNYVRSQF